MSHGKQFTLFTHVGGPNGWYVTSITKSRRTIPLISGWLRKVAIVLEELGLTYESKYLDFQKGEQKAPEHTQYNPNGRIPTLIDHTNGDFAVWESNAILLYLVDRYDKEKRLTVTGEKDTAALIQWLFFQASGQGCVLPSTLLLLSSRENADTSTSHQPVLRPGDVVHALPPRTAPERD